MILTSSEITLHGTLLRIFGVGVLITGEPGIGKSELALSLITRGHQFIADDAPVFRMEQGRLIGTNPLEESLLSVRGIGLVNIKQLFGSEKTVQCQEFDINIHLARGETDPLTHLEGNHSRKDILGCLIPCVTIPIIIPRNLEVLVEIIVRIFLQKNNKETPKVINIAGTPIERMEFINS